MFTSQFLIVKNWYLCPPNHKQYYFKANTWTEREANCEESFITSSTLGREARWL